MVGQILDALDAWGLADNTLIMFLSDNGAPWPGNKKTLFDRGIGTPWIARWPSRLPAGRVVEGLCSTVDLAPTVLQAVGVPAPSMMDGTSILGQLDGSMDGGRSAIFAAIDNHSAYLPTRGIRTDRYKLIWNLAEAPVGLGQLKRFDWAHEVCALRNQPWLHPRIPAELYDLHQDPYEQTNLIADPDHAAVREQHEQLLREHMADLGDALLPGVGA